MATKYVAKWNGVIVGKRITQDRTYSHAIVVQNVEEAHRAAAYNYAATATDRSNFEYYTRIAEGRSQFKHTAEEVVEASIKIDGGYEAYIGRVRERMITWFEEKKAKGYFEPCVAAWAGRLDLAAKAVSQHTGPKRKLIGIVEAEKV